MRLVLAAALTFGALAAPASAAKPTKMVFDLNHAEYEALLSDFLTARCGTAVAADASGHVIVLLYSDRSGDRRPVMNVYRTQLRFTNLATGATYFLVDAGPDIFWFDRSTGNLTQAYTGRSLTGSGVIGRVVIDLDTGEVLSAAGNPEGDWVENACAALA